MQCSTSKINVPDPVVVHTQIDKEKKRGLVYLKI